MLCISTIWGDVGGLACPNVQTVPPSAGYLKTGMPDHPQVTNGLCSWLGSSFVGVPSLRRRSVGPRRTDIHVLAALSRHPCRSSHSTPPAFSLHPSRVLLCLACCGMKIKSKSALCAVWAKNPCHWLNTKPVGVSLLTNAVCHSPLMKLAHSHRKQADGSHAPRGNPFNDALRHLRCGARCQALRSSETGCVRTIESPTGFLAPRTKWPLSASVLWASISTVVATVTDIPPSRANRPSFINTKG